MSQLINPDQFTAGQFLFTDKFVNMSYYVTENNWNESSHRLAQKTYNKHKQQSLQQFNLVNNT